jgi:O-antigen ligase
MMWYQRICVGGAGRGAWVLWVLSLATVAILVGLGTFTFGNHTSHFIEFDAAILIAIVLILGAFRPDVALLAFVAAMPLDVTTSIFGAQFRAPDAIVIALAATLIPRVRPRRTPKALTFGLALFVVGVWIAAAFAIDRGIASAGAARYTAVVIVVLAGYALCNDTPALRKRLIAAFICGATVTAVVGLLQSAGVALAGKPYLPGLPNSFLQYYSNYSGYLAMASATSLALVLRQPRGRGWPYAVSLVFLAAGIVTSSSRGGFLAGAVSIVVVVLLSGRVWQRVGWLTAIGLASVVAILLIPGVTSSLVFQRLTNPALTAAADAERTAVQHLGLSLLANHPQGIGYGNFSAYQLVPVASTGTLFHAHDLYIQLGLDSGWLGLAGLLVVALGVLRRAPRAQDPLLIGAVAALAGFLAQGVNDYLIYDTPLLVGVGLMVILVYTAPEPGRPISASLNAPNQSSRAEAALERGGRSKPESLNRSWQDQRRAER